jgi:O-succinylbenzoate synthase
MIHRLTGHFWGDFMKQRIFQPLGMASTRVISEADIVPNRSSGYRIIDGQIKNQEWVAPSLNTTADGPLEYLEQPCATVPELAELRLLVDVPIAADESIRKAEDPLHVVRSGAADVAVLKVAPLGGVARLLDIADQIDVPVVVSSALDSAVGIGRGLLAAGALPELRHACGLGTGGLFVEDVVEPVTPVDGYLPVAAVAPDMARLRALAAPPERRTWWIDRIKACYPSGRTDLFTD